MEVRTHKKRTFQKVSQNLSSFFSSNPRDKSPTFCVKTSTGAIKRIAEPVPGSGVSESCESAALCLCVCVCVCLPERGP